MALDASSFRPDRAVSAAGHARTFEETEAWVRPLLRRVPITRLSNVTPLDFLAVTDHNHAGAGMQRPSYALGLAEDD